MLDFIRENWELLASIILPALPFASSRVRAGASTAGRRFWQLLPYYLELARCSMLRAVISRATAARYGRNSTYLDSFGVLHLRGIIEDKSFYDEAVFVDPYTLVRRCSFTDCTLAMGGECSSMEDSVIKRTNEGE